ncbi:MAG TPA: hypothetical protein VNO32_22670 [Candidatus Acidoferrum sp.]|nr:hypothetical protein [Candidatus Acidoferrum sp.]
MCPPNKEEASQRGYRSAALGGSRFLGFTLDALFDTHVLQFAGLEDFAALEAFHKLGVLVAGDDLHARVFAGRFFRVFRLGERL